MKTLLSILALSILTLSACTPASTPEPTPDPTPEPPVVEPTPVEEGISDEMMEKHDLTEEEVVELEGMGISDESIDAWVDEIKAMGPGPFDFNAELTDVSGGTATGTAGAYFEEGYTMFAEFKDLPHPEEGFFYEGWVVRQDPLSVISTGEATRSLGDYSNTFTSEIDLTDHDFYVLTLEPDDGNPDPADHILEGTMTMKE